MDQWMNVFEWIRMDGSTAGYHRFHKFHVLRAAWLCAQSSFSGLTAVILACLGRIAMLREQLRLRNDHLLAQRARLPEEHQELLLYLRDGLRMVMAE